MKEGNERYGYGNASFSFLVCLFVCARACACARVNGWLQSRLHRIASQVELLSGAGSCEPFLFRERRDLFFCLFIQLLFFSNKFWTVSASRIY